MEEMKPLTCFMWVCGVVLTRESPLPFKNCQRNQKKKKKINRRLGSNPNQVQGLAACNKKFMT